MWKKQDKKLLARALCIVDINRTDVRVLQNIQANKFFLNNNKQILDPNILNFLYFKSI